MEIYDYMLQRAAFENQDHMLPKQFYRDALRQGCRSFFKVQVDDKGNVIRDDENPRLFQELAGTAITLTMNSGFARPSMIAWSEKGGGYLRSGNPLAEEGKHLLRKDSHVTPRRLSGDQAPVLPPLGPATRRS